MTAKRMWVRTWTVGVMPLVTLSLALLQATRAEETNAVPMLATELAVEGRHEAAAIEYRRLALSEPQGERRAGYYWAAAYEYVKERDFELASRMLDRVEENSQQLAAPTLLLRGEAAIRNKRPEEAAFYYQSVLGAKPEGTPDASQTNALLKARVAATRHLARALAESGNIAGTRDVLVGGSSDNSAGIAALDGYARGHDKKPWLGGLLGMVPGLGYAYSGEYGNGLRSLILNSLFIYAMADTADKDQWGAFSAITFFEITWYTGSIYGGVDAAYRHNRDRLNECLDTIDRDSGFSADLRQIPIVTLRFEF